MPTTPDFDLPPLSKPDIIVGNYLSHREVTVMLHPFSQHFPRLSPTARVADNASLIGAVEVSDEASIWFGAVLRADCASISIGPGANVQDNCVLHGGEGGPIRLDRDVSVGHGAILHCCTVEEGCVIGMGAILLDGCVIGAGSLVAAGALVTKDTVIPPASLVIGRPAKVARALTEEEVAANYQNAQIYRSLSAQELPLAAEVSP